MNKYDTFWLRFFALILDGFALGLLDEFLKLFDFADVEYISMVQSIIRSNVPYVYSILMIGKYGQTLGKMAMKIKVVDNITQTDVNYYQAFKREAVPFVLVNLAICTSLIIGDFNHQTFELSILEYIILFLPSFMLIIWSLLEIITMLFDDRNRALHDKISGTVVVKISAR